MYLRDPGSAQRDNAREVSAVYVLLDPEQAHRIAAYFTISNAILVPASVPAQAGKRLPRYDSRGAVKLGRMARDDDYAGYDLGTILVARAFATALSVAKQGGSIGLVVDAKNARLAEWYVSRGFLRLKDASLTLFIPNTAIAAYLHAFNGPPAA
jgi:GNAT superfamily N-acetyltransferase